MELLLLLIVGFVAFDAFSSDGVDDTPKPTPSGGEAGPENEVIFGTSAADSISAGAGKDLVIGGAGADKLEGGSDWDVILGEGGADSIYGGRGIDILAGGAGNDLIYGLNDNDLLIGGAGADLIYGGDGADVLSSSSGSDTLYGEAGDDLLSGYDNRINDTTSEILANNLLTSEAGAAAYVASYKTFAKDLYGSAFDAGIRTRLDAALTSVDLADRGDDILLGGVGNDTIVGDLGDTLTGGTGNDLFVVLAEQGGNNVVINDLDLGLDRLRIVVPAGINQVVTFADIAGPSGPSVSVSVGGQVVTTLLGLTKAQIPANFIQLETL